MPRVSKRPMLQRASVKIEDLERLVLGFYFFRLHNANPMTDAELRQLWQDVGEDLTRLHAKPYPHTRPAGWWSYSAPERRQRVDQGVHPHDNPARNPRLSQELFYGMPVALQSEDDFRAVYESQADYIERLKLWLPGEVGCPPYESEDDIDGNPTLDSHVIQAWWDSQH